MLKSKLLELFSSLSKQEIKELSKQLQGNAQSKTGKVYKLFNYLAKQYPDFPKKKMQKSYVVEKIFSDQKNASKQMLDTMTRLSRIIEDFFVSKELKFNTEQRDFLLLDALRKRNLDKLFFQKAKSREKEWLKKSPAGIDQLYREFLLYRMCYVHPSYEFEMGSPYEPIELIRRLDKYFCTEKSYIGQFYYTALLEFPLPEKGVFLGTSFLEEINERESHSSPRIEIFFRILNDLKNGKHRPFSELKNEFFDNIDLFNASEITDIFVHLCKMCSAEVYGKYATSKEDLFALNKSASEAGIFIEDGIIHITRFSQTVVIACSVKETKWAKKFVDENKKYLAAEFKEETIVISRTTILFAEKDFESVLKELSTVKFQVLLFNLMGRTLQLQSYFELQGYEELFYNAVRSFTTFLKRNKEVTDEIKLPWLQFIQFANKLKQVYHAKTEIPVLLDQLKEEVAVHHRTWLEEKAKELL